MIDEGVLLMENLHLHRGYNLRLLEVLYNQQPNVNSDGFYSGIDEHVNYCPINNESIGRSLLIKPKDLAFGNYVCVDCCKSTTAKTNLSLLKHLCSAAYDTGCHRHLAAFYYVRTVFLIDKNAVFKDIRQKIEDLELEYQTRPEINNEGSSTPINQMEIDNVD